MREPSFNPPLRKRPLGEETDHAGISAGEIDLPSCATLAYSSEAPSYPVDHIVDGRIGPGATRWVSDRVDTTERIVIEFDQAQEVSRVIYEVEEKERERTQEVQLETFSNDGKTHRQILVQEYTFSPGGATFQREDLLVQLRNVQRLCFTIVPNKQGSGSATLTSVRLFQ